MKKFVVTLGIMMLLCASVSPLYAGGILNKSNMSADYFRSLTRHASVDAADIVAFNPAGVMELENGFYGKVDILYINKEYGNDVPASFEALAPGGSGDLDSDEPSVIPGIFAVYKQDKWAGFFAVTVPGGGGEVDYKDGNARTSALAFSFIANPAFGGAYTGIDRAELQANSYNIGYTLGGAYAINDMVSVAGGVRYISAKQEFEGTVDLTSLVPPSVLEDVYEVELERDATGLGYFLGLSVVPNDKWNFGLLYHSNTELDYKSDVSKDNSPMQAITNGVGWPDGSKEREDLPGLIGLGVGYNATDKIRLELAYTRYLEGGATWEGLRYDESDDPGDSWEVGFSVTYTFNPQWRASIGYLHTDIVGMEPESLLPEAAELDASTIGLGAVYSPTDRWDITFGYTNVTYDSEETDTFTTRAPAGSELEKAVNAFSIGAQYRF